MNKKSYFQGGGGVNEPTPGKKKYKVDKAIVVQPRFVEPFYRNYDLYDVEGVNGPAKHGPGSGYHNLNKHKSIKDFLEFRRKRLKGKYVADDFYIEDNSTNYNERVNKMKIRTTLFSEIIKTAIDKKAGPNYDLGKGLYSEMSDGKVDSVEEFREEGDHGPGALMADDNEDHMMPPKEHGTSIYDWKNSPYQGTPGAKKKKKDNNNIDFPIDDQIGSGSIVGDSGTLSDSIPIGGQLDEYLPEKDLEDKSPDQLDFGRDYVEQGDPPSAPDSEHKDIDKIMNKYLTPAETDLFGLPDGIDPISDLDPEATINTENSNYGITDSGRQMYEDKWNI